MQDAAQDLQGELGDPAAVVLLGSPEPAKVSMVAAFSPGVSTQRRAMTIPGQLMSVGTNCKHSFDKVIDAITETTRSVRYEANHDCDSCSARSMPDMSLGN